MGERERTDGTCSTCDLPAAAHQRIVCGAITLPPLMAGQEHDGAWTWPIDGDGPIDLWRPWTMVTVGIERDACGSSAYVGFQQGHGPELGWIELIPYDGRPSPAALRVLVEGVIRTWTERAQRDGVMLVFADLDLAQVVAALVEAHATLGLEAKAAERTS